MKLVDVSVVVPCFNCISTIERAIASVANQTFRPQELILIDDCSEDDTLNKLHELQNVYGASWISVVALPNNVGAGSARNKGWALARCKFIAFLDADDTWSSNKIERQFTYMENSKADLTGHQVCVSLSKTPEVIQSLQENPVWSKISVFELLFSNRFSTPTVMVRRTVPFRFATGGRYSEDYGLWLTMAANGLELHHSSETLTLLHKKKYGEGGLSSSLLKMELGELKNYWNLWRNTELSRTLIACAAIFSCLKFLKRQVFVFFKA